MTAELTAGAKYTFATSAKRTRNRWYLCGLAFAILLGLANAVPSAQAQTHTMLYSFTGYVDGYPPSGVIRDAAGNLYGTTFYGGGAYGTVFRLDPAGTKSVLHTFTRTHGDGEDPTAPLVLAGDVLYGTTASGGIGFGFGTVFRKDKSGETILYAFPGASGGSVPLAGLIRDEAGNLYGTAADGGDMSCGNGAGCGLIFKLDAAGNETVLYRFPGGVVGSYPATRLIRDDAGNLYGATSYGGDLACHSKAGCGTVFKLNPSGEITTLHIFTGKADGGISSNLIRDSAGNLYGTTELGGSSNRGIVYKLDTIGKLTVLHNFTGSDGDLPVSGLIRDSKGNLYGTTNLGGAFDQGTVFELDATGNYTVLHSFSGADGAYPVADLILDNAGTLYGATNNGGAFNFGTVFKITF